MEDLCTEQDEDQSVEELFESSEDAFLKSTSSCIFIKDTTA